jgi:predicted RNase H-like HicB family nuclease
MYTYKIHLHKEPEGGFTVSVPALSGCITYGQDLDEAISMAKEAIELYIEAIHWNTLYILKLYEPKPKASYQNIRAARFYFQTIQRFTSIVLQPHF